MYCHTCLHAEFAFDSTTWWLINNHEGNFSRWCQTNKSSNNWHMTKGTCDCKPTTCGWWALHLQGGHTFWGTRFVHKLSASLVSISKSDHVTLQREINDKDVSLRWHAEFCLTSPMQLKHLHLPKNGQQPTHQCMHHCQEAHSQNRLPEATESLWQSLCLCHACIIWGCDHSAMLMDAYWGLMLQHAGYWPYKPVSRWRSHFNAFYKLPQLHVEMLGLKVATNIVNTKNVACGWGPPWWSWSLLLRC